MAKEFLSQKGVDFIAYDVTQDNKALKEMMEISGGARSVPVISICNEVMVGFDSHKVEHSLKCLEQSSTI